MRMPLVNWHAKKFSKLAGCNHNGSGIGEAKQNRMRQKVDHYPKPQDSKPELYYAHEQGQ